MVSLIVLAGGLFAVLVISTLLYYYKKYKTETEARFLEIRLLVKSAKEHQNHISKQLLDIMKSNKDDLQSHSKALENELMKNIQITEHKLEESRKRMEEHFAAMERKNDQKINSLKESFDTQFDVLKRGMNKS